jgi:hypothetical protein
MKFLNIKISIQLVLVMALGFPIISMEEEQKQQASTKTTTTQKTTTKTLEEDDFNNLLLVFGTLDISSKQEGCSSQLDQQEMKEFKSRAPTFIEFKKIAKNSDQAEKDNEDLQ